MFKKTLFSLSFVALMFFASYASAASLSAEQVNAILNMLRAFGADESVVQEVRMTLSGQGSGASTGLSTTSSTNSGAQSQYSYQTTGSPAFFVSFCPNIYRNLKLGDKGSDVSELQRFLKEAGVYSYPEITGYFGAVTQEAVQRFQARAGVVSYGTPQSTGYGLVGPSTRAAIKRACGQDKIVKDFLVTPNAGSVPFVSAVVFKYKGSNCTSFTLDWGDGSTPTVQYPQGGSCDDYLVKKTVKHTYTKKGNFTVKLSISQNGKTETYSKEVHSGTPFARHFDINPTEGDAPLLVGLSFAIPDNACSAYKVDWGDDTQESKEKSADSCSDSEVKMQALTHTYNQPGDYTLRLYMGQTPLDSLPVVEQREIKVRSTNSDSSSDYRKNIISVRPSAGKAPLVVRVSISGESASCSSYEIDWGDSTAKQIYTADQKNCSGNFGKELIHTYFIPGVYTLKVKAGKQDLSQIPYEYHYITVSQ